MEYRQLGQTDMQVSALGFGASSLGGVFHEIDEDEGIRTVHRAIKLGINFIDVSPYYGITRAETVLGKALAAIPRDQYYLATKAGRYGDHAFDFSAQRVVRSVDESLARLGVDYVDLIQCHDIEFGDLDQVVRETLPALNRLRQTGKVRYVGVTGLPLKIFGCVLGRVEPRTVDTILSYCHFALNDTSLTCLLDDLQAKRIGVINASPTGMGLLTDRGAPPWHPASDQIKQTCQQAAAHCRDRGQDIAELAIRFAVSDCRIATTLVSTASVQHIEANVRAAESPLDEALLAEVRAILRPIHDQSWPSGRLVNN